ncbi:MAG: class I SAM-dependent methyltransferase [Chitinophagaceae bacterium]|nr:MAG: class I SAM-dependent methyltransferase [Chitinophagaceae bacterium]
MKTIQSKAYSNNGNREVLRFVNKQGEVLDVGCGTGDNARILMERGFPVTGITISETELKLAKPFLREAFIYDLENGLPPALTGKRFKYILCSHVLEHICYPEKLLAALKTCLEEDGQLIVALPNLFHYSSRWKLMQGKFEYQESGIWDNTHFKWYTFSSGRRLLEQNGFQVIVQTVTGKLPGYSFFSAFLPGKLEQKAYGLLKRFTAY